MKIFYICGYNKISFNPDQMPYKAITDLKNQVVEDWEYFYPKLVKYHAAFGHCNIPEGWGVDPELSDWVHKVHRIQALLPKEFRSKLAKLKFILNFDEYRWNVMYEAFRSFVKKHRHGMVPSKETPYKQLYNWLQKQKTNKHRLSKEQLEKLNKAGIIWNIQTVKDEKWEKRFKELCVYKRRYGDCLVPRSWPKDPDLGKWVERQRYFKAKGKLRRDRKKQLDTIGFSWTTEDNELKKIIYNKLWDKKYRQLVAYKRKHGHTTVPHEWAENPSLSRWVNDQRIKGRENKLSEEQIRKLNELDFVWEPLEGHWEERYDALVRFKEQFGHLKVLFNQTDEKMADNPEIVSGLSVTLSGGFNHNWNSETFRESIAGNDVNIPIELKVGWIVSGGASFNENQFGAQVGIGGGLKVAVIGTQVKEAISVIEDEVDIIEKATDVVIESWIVNNSKATTDADGNITGYEATVATRNTAGKLIDTGVKIYSGAKKNDDGTVQSNGMWESKAYSEAATKAENED
jgi:hypothetical protein